MDHFHWIRICWMRTAQCNIKKVKAISAVTHNYKLHSYNWLNGHANLRKSVCTFSSLHCAHTRFSHPKLAACEFLSQSLSDQSTKSDREETKMCVAKWERTFFVRVWVWFWEQHERERHRFVFTKLVYVKRESESVSFTLLIYFAFQHLVSKVARNAKSDNGIFDSQRKFN